MNKKNAPNVFLNKRNNKKIKKPNINTLPLHSKLNYFNSWNMSRYLGESNSKYRSNVMHYNSESVIL